MSVNATERNDDHRRHFHALPRERQEEAIRGLAADGMSDLGIAAATGYAIEVVRTIVGQRKGAPTA